MLGNFVLTRIPAVPRGVSEIDVTFDLDANVILNVSAKEMSIGEAGNITMMNYKGRLSQADSSRDMPQRMRNSVSAWRHAISWRAMYLE